MGIIIFNKELDDYSNKYIVTNQGKLPFPIQQEKMRSMVSLCPRLFESLLLYDGLCFKVYGDNFPFLILYKLLGEKNTLDLIEQKAIQFVLWPTAIAHLVSDVAGVNALSTIRHTGLAYTDPEKSLSRALETILLERGKKKWLIKKVRDVCWITEPDSAEESNEVITSAYTSGKMDVFGFNSKSNPINNMPLNERNELNGYANNLQEYRFVLQNNLCSSHDYSHFKMFQHSQSSIKKAEIIKDIFCMINKAENFPDFQKLFYHISDPFNALMNIRNKPSFIGMRKWLSGAVDEYDRDDVLRRYMDANDSPNKSMVQKILKSTKSILMAAAGIGASAAISGITSNATVNVFLNFFASIALDLLDNQLIGSIASGMKPRMFYTEMRKEYPEINGRDIFNH